MMYFEGVWCVSKTGQLLNRKNREIYQQGEFNQHHHLIQQGLTFVVQSTFTSRHEEECPVKAYICVFVCFAVKAIHLELVGDLTTFWLRFWVLLKKICGHERTLPIYLLRQRDKLCGS